MKALLRNSCIVLAIWSIAAPTNAASVLFKFAGEIDQFFYEGSTPPPAPNINIGDTFEYSILVELGDSWSGGVESFSAEMTSAPFWADEYWIPTFSDAAVIYSSRGDYGTDIRFADFVTYGPDPIYDWGLGKVIRTGHGIWIPGQSDIWNVSGDTTITDVQSVPLPAAIWMFLSAVGGLGFVKRKKH